MITVQQIAEAAGVSASTVSKVLNGHYKEAWPSSARRAAHIRDVAKRLNYRPNSAAKAISRGTFDCIAVLQDDHRGRSGLPQELLFGIHDALNECGKHLTFARVSDALITDPARLPKLLTETMTDGFLVNINSMVPSRMVEILGERHLPAVFINSKQGHDCVRPDDLLAGRALTEEVLSMGCRHPVYVDFHYDLEVRHFSREDRMAGYREAMLAACLKPQVIAPSPRTSTKSQCFEIAKQWFADHPETDAAIGYHQHQIHPLWVVAAEMGRPIRVAAITTANEGDFLDATARLPEYEAGRAAVEMLLAKIADPLQRFPEVKLPFTIQIRD